METRKPLTEIVRDLLSWCACEEDIHSLEHWVFHKQHSRRACSACGGAITDENSLREHASDCAYVAAVQRCRGKQLTPWRRASH